MNSQRVYAGFWLRFLAVFVDGFLVSIFQDVFRWVLPSKAKDLWQTDGIINGTQEIVRFTRTQLPPTTWKSLFASFFTIDSILLAVLTVVFVWLYFAFMESSKYQATFGKQLVGIQVTDINGARISFGKASVRHFSKFLSLAAFGVGYLMIFWTEKKQGLHDIIAKTLVVRKPKETVRH